MFHSTNKIGIWLLCTLVGLILFQCEALLAGPIHLSTSYSTSFDALANSRDGANVAWQNDRTLEGWYATRFSYRVGNGADNIGALYSFGATASTERALGSIASDTVGDIHYGVRFINDTNAILNNITVRYTGEQWRDSGYQNQQTLRFTYQIGATDVLSGQWMAFTTLNFTGPSARGYGNRFRWKRSCESPGGIRDPDRIGDCTGTRNLVAMDGHQ